MIASFNSGSSPSFIVRSQHGLDNSIASAVAGDKSSSSSIFFGYTSG